MLNIMMENENIFCPCDEASGYTFYDEVDCPN